MPLLTAAAWILLALVHLLPALALFLPKLITRLYGLAPGSANFLLMHHRAALFLGIVIACVWSAFDPRPRPLAAVMTALSMLSFLALYGLGKQPRELRSIAIADLVGLPALAFVVWQVL